MSDIIDRHKYSQEELDSISKTQKTKGRLVDFLDDKKQRESHLVNVSQKLKEQQDLVNQKKLSKAFGLQGVSIADQRDALGNPSHFFLSTVDAYGPIQKSPFVLTDYPGWNMTTAELSDNGFRIFEKTKNIWEVSINGSILNIVRFVHNGLSPSTIKGKKKLLGALRKKYLNHIMDIYPDIKTIKIVSKNRTSGKRRKPFSVDIDVLESFCKKHL